MPIVNLQKTLKVFHALGPSLHRQKIDDLDKQQRLPVTRFTYSFDQFAQSRNKSIVANTKQWTTRNVAHACRLDDEHAGPPFSKASIPIEVLLRYKTIFSRAPRHHRRHPRAATRFEFADCDRAEESRASGLFRRGPARFQYLVANWIRKFPHVLVT